MVRVSDLKSASQIAEEEARANLEVERELVRTALANAVAIRVIRYRAEHGLSQTQLARNLGMHQPAIARLESGDHEPSLSTLGRIAKGLGIEFQIDVSPAGRIELLPEQTEPSETQHSSQADLASALTSARVAALNARQSVLTRLAAVHHHEDQAASRLPDPVVLRDFGAIVLRAKDLVVTYRLQEEKDELFQTLVHALQEEDGLLVVVTEGQAEQEHLHSLTDALQRTGGHLVVLGAGMAQGKSASDDAEERV